MVICVDVGNTLTKGFAVSGRTVAVLGRVETRRLLGPHADATVRGWSRRTGGPVEGVIVASVVPGVDRPLIGALRRRYGRDPIRVDHGMRLPFALGVKRPERLGADRISAAAGALARGGTGAVVVDAGSAITVDLVHRNRYLGGIILAGPEIALLALADHTAKLPRIGYRGVETPFPRRFDTTKRAMVLGASLGAVGGVREAVSRLESVAGARMRKVVTGGLAPALRPHLPRSWTFDRHLTARGLYRLWRLNRTH